jgi:hypothetical protein
MLSISAALSMSVDALIASNARADATVCTSTIQGQSISLGNIVVPEDAECTLFNVTVSGNIDQQSGSRLFLRFNVRVDGNISSHGGVLTVFSPGITGPIHVAGNVEIDSNNQVEICGSHIGGNVTISNTNPGPLLPK